jgi:hypothetical protein
MAVNLVQIILPAVNYFSGTKKYVIFASENRTRKPPNQKSMCDYTQFKVEPIMDLEAFAFEFKLRQAEIDRLENNTAKYNWRRLNHDRVKRLLEGERQENLPLDCKRD